MLWGCFSVAGTEGLIRVEEKLSAPKYWESLNKNPIQSIQNLRRAEGSPSNRTMNLNTARVDYRQLCECPWVAQPQPEIEPSQIFLEKPENVQPDRAWEVKRWGEEWQITDKCWWAKLVASTKKTWGCKGASAKYLVKGMNTYAMYLFQFFIFIKFTKLWQFCFCFVNMVYGV